jgi:hypothetical protein
MVHYLFIYLFMYLFIYLLTTVSCFGHEGRLKVTGHKLLFAINLNICQLLHINLG